MGKSNYSADFKCDAVQPLLGNSWAKQSRQPTDFVLQALLMAVWRRKSKHPVLVHIHSLSLLRDTLPGSGSGIAIYQPRLGHFPACQQSETLNEQTGQLSSLPAM